MVENLTLNNNFDKYEFYSYIVYLYGYSLFYLFIFEQNLVRAIYISLLANVMLKYTINHNTLYFISHKYWRNNLSDIAMPQLVSCVSSIITYDYNNYVSFPINFIIYYFIEKIYKKESRYSRNMRIILLFLFVVSKIIF